MIKHFIAAILAASMLVSAAFANAEIVNINKADAAALAENLNGIGPVKSKAIVNYRRKHGSFKSLQDLTNVDGVGEELLKINRRNMSLTRGVTKASGKPKASAKSTRKKTKTRKSSRKKTTTRKEASSKSASGKKKTAKKSSRKKTASRKSKTAKKSSRKK